MYLVTKSSFSRKKNGCLAQAVSGIVLLWRLQVSAMGTDAGGRELGSSFALAVNYRLVGLCGVCAILLGLVVVILVRWMGRLRQRALKRRDDEMFQLIDQWTKSLQDEVAERKQAQRALQESQDIIMRQERLAAVGQLTAGLAHEFNNILTIVQGHASLLMDQPNLEPDSVKSLSTINESVERMAKLVRQMLAFSRKQVMQQKPLDVEAALSHTYETFGRILGDDVTLRFDIAPDLPPILADAEMFQQIVINLAVNAREAMIHGGQLTISAAETKIAAGDIPAKSERKAGRFVCVSVADTGSGMDAATITHLFEPFFTTKDVGKGPGLGLATVHGMVNQHNGWIEVRSTVGQGTTFDIYLPVTERAVELPAKPADPPEVRGGKETVLLVEDEVVLRELVRDILTIHGYRVLEASNGREALQVWEDKREKVDLLLTDMAMPNGFSGRDLADRLRKDDPRLPVIFSSGYSRELIERNEDAHHDTTYLSKPYRPAELAQTVRHALDASQRNVEPQRPAQRPSTQVQR